MARWEADPGILRAGSPLLRGPARRFGNGTVQATLHAMAGPSNCHTNKVQVEAHVAANLWVVRSQAFMEDLSYFAENGPQEREVTTTSLGPTSPIQLVKQLKPCMGAEPSTPPVSNLYLPDDRAS